MNWKVAQHDPWGLGEVAHLNTEARTEECAEIADTLKHLKAEVISLDLQVGTKETVSGHPEAQSATSDTGKVVCTHPNSRRRRWAMTSNKSEDAVMTPMMTAVSTLSGRVRRLSSCPPSLGREFSRLWPRIWRSSKIYSDRQSYGQRHGNRTSITAYPRKAKLKAVTAMTWMVLRARIPMTVRTNCQRWARPKIMR